MLGFLLWESQVFAGGWSALRLSEGPVVEMHSTRPDSSPILAGGFLGIRMNESELGLNLGGLADFLIARYLTFMANAAWSLGIVDIDTTDGAIRNRTNTNVQVLVGFRLPLN